jgi:hypothetical protein
MAHTSLPLSGAGPLSGNQGAALRVARLFLSIAKLLQFILPPGSMLVFIDESGDPGFRLEKGSSAVFVAALAAFRDPAQARAARRAAMARATTACGAAGHLAHPR